MRKQYDFSNVFNISSDWKASVRKNKQSFSSNGYSPITRGLVGYDFNSSSMKSVITTKFTLPEDYLISDSVKYLNYEGTPLINEFVCIQFYSHDDKLVNSHYEFRLRLLDLKPGQSMKIKVKTIRYIDGRWDNGKVYPFLISENYFADLRDIILDQTLSNSFRKATIYENKYLDYTIYITKDYDQDEHNFTVTINNFPSSINKNERKFSNKDLSSLFSGLTMEGSGFGFQVPTTQRGFELNLVRSVNVPFSKGKSLHRMLTVFNVEQDKSKINSFNYSLIFKPDTIQGDYLAGMINSLIWAPSGDPLRFNSNIVSNSVDWFFSAEDRYYRLSKDAMEPAVLEDVVYSAPTGIVGAPLIAIPQYEFTLLDFEDHSQGFDYFKIKDMEFYDPLGSYSISNQVYEPYLDYKPIELDQFIQNDDSVPEFNYSGGLKQFWIDLTDFLSRQGYNVKDLSEVNLTNLSSLSDLLNNIVKDSSLKGGFEKALELTTDEFKGALSWLKDIYPSFILGVKANSYSDILTQLSPFLLELNNLMNQNSDADKARDTISSINDLSYNAINILSSMAGEIIPHDTKVFNITTMEKFITDSVMYRELKNFVHNFNQLGGDLISATKSLMIKIQGVFDRVKEQSIFTSTGKKITNVISTLISFSSDIFLIVAKWLAISAVKAIVKAVGIVSNCYNLGYTIEYPYLNDEFQAYFSERNNHILIPIGVPASWSLLNNQAIKNCKFIKFMGLQHSDGYKPIAVYGIIINIDSKFQNNIKLMNHLFQITKHIKHITRGVSVLLAYAQNYNSDVLPNIDTFYVPVPGLGLKLAWSLVPFAVAAASLAALFTAGFNIGGFVSAAAVATTIIGINVADAVNPNVYAEYDGKISVTKVANQVNLSSVSPKSSSNYYNLIDFDSSLTSDESFYSRFREVKRPEWVFDMTDSSFFHTRTIHELEYLRDSKLEGNFSKILFNTSHFSVPNPLQNVASYVEWLSRRGQFFYSLKTGLRFMPYISYYSRILADATGIVTGFALSIATGKAFGSTAKFLRESLTSVTKAAQLKRKVKKALADSNIQSPKEFKKFKKEFLRLAKEDLISKDTKLSRSKRNSKLKDISKDLDSDNKSQVLTALNKSLTPDEIDLAVSGLDSKGYPTFSAFSDVRSKFLMKNFGVVSERFSSGNKGSSFIPKWIKGNVKKETLFEAGLSSDDLIKAQESIISSIGKVTSDSIDNLLILTNDKFDKVESKGDEITDLLKDFDILKLIY